jgi:hypothetical protein
MITPEITSKDEDSRREHSWRLFDLLQGLIYQNLQKRTPLTPEQKRGQKIKRINRLLKDTKPLVWERWIMSRTLGDGCASFEYRERCKILKSTARNLAFDFKFNISRIFFQICKELEIPAELLAPENLPESLASVFLYIIHLSDEIRSTDPRSEGFLEKLQRYKQIADVFYKINIDIYLFENPSDLDRFFQIVDEKLIFSGKLPLKKHDMSSLNLLFISPDFVLAGFFNPLPESDDLLRLTIAAIMHRFHESTEDWFSTQEAERHVYALCDIFHKIRKHSQFRMDIFKFNILCKLLPWTEFTNFLQRLSDPDSCDGNDFSDEHAFICMTLREMAKSIQDRDDMDVHYARVLSNHPSRQFEADKNQTLKFVCSLLSIPTESEED